MNSKIHSNRKKPRFQPTGLIFYCYLLIPLNELARNVLKFNKLKIRKKIIDKTMVSIQFAGNEDFPPALWLAIGGEGTATNATTGIWGKKTCNHGLHFR